MADRRNTDGSESRNSRFWGTSIDLNDEEDTERERERAAGSDGERKSQEEAAPEDVPVDKGKQKIEYPSSPETPERERSVFIIDEGETSGLSNLRKELDAMYQDDDAINDIQNFNPTLVRMNLDPVSGRLAPEFFCFEKVLHATDVTPPYYCRLNLTAEQARTIPNRPALPQSYMMNTTTILVFDQRNRRWFFNFTGYRFERMESYTMDGSGWRNLLCVNNLRAGDSIYFYKQMDPRILAYGHFYVLFYTRAGQSSSHDT